jgi:hypothetical protein
MACKPERALLALSIAQDESGIYRVPRRATPAGNFRLPVITRTRLSVTIATKRKFLSYLRTDMYVIGLRSNFCINKLRRQEIIEWE